MSNFELEIIKPGGVKGKLRVIEASAEVYRYIGITYTVVGIVTIRERLSSSAEERYRLRVTTPQRVEDVRAVNELELRDNQ